MTKQTKPLSIDELKFPGTNANKVKYHGHGNGFNIDYIDDKNEPQSAFILAATWDRAKEIFEQEISHTIIIDHCPVKEIYEPWNLKPGA